MTTRGVLVMAFCAAFACSEAISDNALPKDCAIMPVEKAKGLIHQCSRPGPKNVTGFWAPSVADVMKAERRLPAFLSHSGHKIDLSRTHRQYMGIISAGKKLIYLNALLA